MSENNTTEFNPFDKMSFTYDKCFICGKKLSVDTTVEHVYPKWLQNDFDLWNKNLVLLNGSEIKYRQMYIPCCFECNEIMSKNLEKPIKQAVKKGYDEFVKLDKKVVFQWLNKISYGMLFKELSLKCDLKNPKSKMIYSEDNLKNHKMQYLFLKSILKQTKYEKFPWSMLVFKVKKIKDKQYWAYDNPFIKTFFILMNDIGIITHLMDNGCSEDFFMQYPDMVELLHKELHPIQFQELCAKFHYKASLLNKIPSYINLFDEENEINTIMSLTQGGIIYDDWSQEMYAYCLAFFLEQYGIKIEDIYRGEDKVMTFIRNEDGTFKDIV